MCDKKINVITFVTNDYLGILEKYFLSTLPLEVKHINIKCVNRRGYFRHDKFAVELEKIRVGFILEQIIINKGEAVMMIDADVVFSGTSFLDEVTNILKDYDIVFQNNTQWYNFGIFAVNCNDKMVSVFESLLAALDDNVSFCKTLNTNPRIVHDQHIINDLIRFDDEIKHTSLPLTYFGGHFGGTPKPSGWILYHATGTKTMNDKIKKLNSYLRHEN